MTTTITECRHCGKSHGVRCPEVKALEYFESGELKRVEFVTPADLTNMPPASFVPTLASKSIGDWIPNPIPFGTTIGYESPGGFKPVVDCGVSDK